MKKLLLILMVVGLVLSCRLSFGQQESSLPEDVRKSMDYLVGFWRYEGTVGNVAVKGTMAVRWAPGGYCQIYNITSREGGKRKGAGRGTVVCGYDPWKKQAIERGFASNGSYGTSRYDLTSPVMDKGVIEGERVNVVEGKELKGKIRVERMGRDEFTYSVKSADGQDAVLHFRKAEKPKGRKGKAQKEKV